MKTPAHMILSLLLTTLVATFSTHADGISTEEYCARERQNCEWQKQGMGKYIYLCIIDSGCGTCTDVKRMCDSRNAPGGNSGLWGSRGGLETARPVLTV